MPSRRLFNATKFKRQVVLEAEKSNNLSAARKFNVNESNVRLWWQQRQSFFACSSTRKAFRGPKHGAHPEIKEELVRFVNDLRLRHIAVTREAIQIKAKQLANGKGNRTRGSDATFKASVGWLRHFMHRAGFSLKRRTSISQKLPPHFEEKLVEFPKYVIRLRTEYDCPLGHIGNVDETPVFIDMPYGSTVCDKGSKSVPIMTSGNEKL